MRRALCPFFLFSFVLLISARAQSSPDEIKHLIEEYSKKSPQEKVYIHLDRPGYSSGDTIWFKVYLTDAIFHVPDSVSKIIYVDLVQKNKNQLIFHKTLKNENGFANGEFNLPDSLKAGVYEVVGYTNYMRNYSSGFFFRKEIIIQNATSSRTENIKTDLQSTLADLQFFPEGGNLIAGLQARVAFKAVNKYGKGVNVKGFIFSEKGDTVAAIGAQHLGMGSFVFKPKASGKYFAALSRSSTQHFALPEVKDQGYTLFVDNLTNAERIKVTARSNSATKDRPILMGHQRGNVVFAAQGTSDGNSFTWELAKDNLQENGVVQLTLFDGNGQPQCERLIFHQENSPLQISIASDKMEYMPREKVVLSINVKDQDDYPLSGNFSVSVTDNNQVAPQENGENIDNYFFLTSDVQNLTRDGVIGGIEQPGHYFDLSNASALVDLDILLMTQGWRRFLWSDVMRQKNMVKQFEVEQGIVVKGTATIKGIPAKSIPVSLLTAEGNESNYLSATTDAFGRFAFSGVDANNETTIFILNGKDKGTTTTFRIDQPDIPILQPFTLPFESELSNPSVTAKVRMDKTKILKQVDVKADREKKSDPRKTMYEGTGFTTIAVDPQICATAPSVLSIIQGRVAGVDVRQDSLGNFVLTVRGRQSMSNSPKARNPEVVAVLVDGVVMNIQTLNTISPCIVESIDVVAHAVSSLNAPGLVSVLTKGGSSTQHRDWALANKAVSPGTFTTRIHGYDVPREFYSPKYPLVQDNKAPDFRATIFWSPQIKVERDGGAKIVFWNSDEHTTIRISLEGISYDGKPGHSVYSYTVK